MQISLIISYPVDLLQVRWSTRWWRGWNYRCWSSCLLFSSHLLYSMAGRLLFAVSSGFIPLFPRIQRFVTGFLCDLRQDFVSVKWWCGYWSLTTHLPYEFVDVCFLTLTLCRMTSSDRNSYWVHNIDSRPMYHNKAEYYIWPCVLRSCRNRVVVWHFS